MSARAAACALLVAAGVAGAQSSQEFLVDVGAAQIRQLGLTSRSATVLGALWRTTDDRLATLLSGNYTYAGDSATALQGAAALAWRPGGQNFLQIEGGVTGAAFGVYELGRGGSLNAWLRPQVVVGTGGFWVGGAVAKTDRDELASHSTTLDAGAFARGGDFEATVSFARLRTDDWPLMEAAGVFLLRDAAAHDLQDANLSLRFQHGPLTLDASQTWRGGLRASAASQTALFWSATYAFTPRLSLALATGRQLADPLRGTPDAQVVSAVVRVGVLPLRQSALALGTMLASADLVPQPDGALLVVRVAAPDSSRVEIAGSFSDWGVVPVRHAGEGWEARIPLTRGRYRVAVRINGGPWRAPGNLAMLVDEFGEESGLVVVP